MKAKGKEEKRKSSRRLKKSSGGCRSAQTSKRFLLSFLIICRRVLALTRLFCSGHSTSTAIRRNQLECL